MKMNLNLFKIYGIAVGTFSVIIGIVLLFYKRLDSILSNKETPPEEVKSKRIILAMVAILGGMLSLSAVLFGWPPVSGYLIPPK
jgi:uncharacterized membrane protein